MRPLALLACLACSLLPACGPKEGSDDDETSAEAGTAMTTPGGPLASSESANNAAAACNSGSVTYRQST